MLNLISTAVLCNYHFVDDSVQNILCVISRCTSIQSEEASNMDAVKFRNGSYTNCTTVAIYSRIETSLYHEVWHKEIN